MKEKLKAVASAIAAIEQFGKGAIMPLSGGDIAEIRTIPTGSVGLDARSASAGRAAASSRSKPQSSGRRPRCHAIARRSGRAACARSSTPSTRWTSATRKLGVRIEDLLVCPIRRAAGDRGQAGRPARSA
jgi:hypothetical protein